MPLPTVLQRSLSNCRAFTPPGPFPCLKYRLSLSLSEGGRLQQEMAYVEEKLGVGAGATPEMLIQTPLRPDAAGADVLSSEALLAHLDVLTAAAKVTVEMDDV